MDSSMHFHNLLIFIFEPLRVLKASELNTSTPQSIHTDESPQQIVTNSKKCLQTLIRLYYSCHGGDTCDIFVIHFAMFIGFGALNDISESNLDAEGIENLHATIILCANILCNQSRNYYMAEAVFRLIHRSMPPQDVRILREFATLDDFDEKRERQLTQHIQSEWPLNIVRVPNNSDDRKLGNLLQAFKEFTVSEPDAVDTASSGRSPEPWSKE